jgi:hypothetical protein
MSVIDEALSKAQNDMSKHKMPAASAAKLAAHAETPISRGAYFSLVSIAVLVLVGALLSWNAIKNHPSHTMATAAPKHALSLTGTMIEGGHRLAVINGMPYSVGDKVGDMRLLAVAPSEARLLKRGHDITLRVS